MMWTYFKTKKLSILTLTAGLIYAFLIISSFVDGRDDFLRGYHEADQSERLVFNSKREYFKSYNLTLRPKKGFTSYPDSMINLFDNETIKICNHKMLALGPNELPSTSAKWFFALNNLIIFIIATTFFVIPFHFFRFMSLIKKNIFFESENIRLLRWLGFELLVVYFGYVLSNFMSYRINTSLFSFSEYNLEMNSMEGIWLLFGIVILLIAEILSKALVIKEEQELTI